MTTETNPPSNSPLGVDPPAAKDPVVVPPPAPPANTPPATKQLSQAEYDALQAKANNYDIISGDPELAPKLVDHFRAKTGRLGTPVSAPKPVVNDQQSARDDERFAAMSKRQAQLEVELFKQKHPDMDDLKDDMAKLINRYGMDLEDAYNFSKSAKAQNGQKSPVAPPAVPTSETNNPAGSFDSSNSDLGDVEKRINDPKATPHMDDAIALAFQAAKNRSGQ